MVQDIVKLNTYGWKLLDPYSIISGCVELLCSSSIPHSLSQMMYSHERMYYNAVWLKLYSTKEFCSLKGTEAELDL